MNPKLARQIPPNAVKVIHDEGGYRRVVIYKRENGTFGFEEWRFLEDADSWVPVKKQIETFVSTAGDAVREASSRVPWINTTLGS